VGWGGWVAMRVVRAEGRGVAVGILNCGGKDGVAAIGVVVWRRGFGKIWRVWYVEFFSI